MIRTVASSSVLKRDKFRWRWTGGVGRRELLESSQANLNNDVIRLCYLTISSVQQDWTWRHRAHALDELHWLGFPHRITFKIMHPRLQVSTWSGSWLPYSIVHSGFNGVDGRSRLSFQRPLDELLWPHLIIILKHLAVEASHSSLSNCMEFLFPDYLIAHVSIFTVHRNTWKLFFKYLHKHYIHFPGTDFLILMVWRSLHASPWSNLWGDVIEICLFNNNNKIIME